MKSAARLISIRRHAATFLASIPLLFLLIVMVRFAVGVPFQDQWELVPLLEKLHQGSLSFADLWAQHNEHRILFPRLIMLGLAWLSDWNTHLELEANVVLAFGIFVVYLLQVRATARELARPNLAWAIPLASLVVFSVSQHQNWMWGWQLQMFFTLLCVVAGVLVLANGSFSWARFAAAAAFGVGATYSFANGPLFWPIGLCVVLAVTSSGRQRRVAVAAWLLLAALVIAANYLGYRKPDHHPSLILVFKMPADYARYVLRYLGGIGEPGILRRPALDGTLAHLFGLAGVAAFAWALWSLLCTTAIKLRSLLPYLAMSLYSLGSALGTGLGRLGFGSDQALSSRYSTVVTPFWVSLLVFLMLLAGDTTSPAARDSKAARLVRRRRIVARCLLWGFTAVLAFGSSAAVLRVREHSERLADGRARLLERGLHPDKAADAKGLAFLYPRTGVILDRLPVLLRYRLSLFRGSKPLVP
jgi:hypothetical protein